MSPNLLYNQVCRLLPAKIILADDPVFVAANIENNPV
jgi:hypothetical protein